MSTQSTLNSTPIKKPTLTNQNPNPPEGKGIRTNPEQPTFTFGFGSIFKKVGRVALGAVPGGNIAQAGLDFIPKGGGNGGSFLGIDLGALFEKIRQVFRDTALAFGALAVITIGIYFLLRPTIKQASETIVSATVPGGQAIVNNPLKAATSAAKRGSK